MRNKSQPIVISAGLSGCLLCGSATAVDLTSFKGLGADHLYGRYAPGGDCTREPRVTADESGLSFVAGGQERRSETFVHVLTYAGPDYRGISDWYFPFATSDSSHPLLLTFNAGERRGVVAIEPYDEGYDGGPPLAPFNAALAKGSPYAKCR
jgi:hypothetical protein